MYIHDRPSWTLPDEQNVPGRRNPFPGAPYFLPCLLSETARNAKSCRRVIREPPPFTREERMQETPLRENTRLHRSLFLRELRASIGGNSTPRKKKSFHPHHPTFFTTRTRSKLRTRLTSREKPWSKPSPPAPDFSTHSPSEKRDCRPDNLLSNPTIGTYSNKRSIFIPIY